ncbi:hypothetical protein Ahia01_001010200 [Argonauta hians]
MLLSGKHLKSTYLGYENNEFKKQLSTDSNYFTNGKIEDCNDGDYNQFLNVFSKKQPPEINHVIKPLRTQGQWLSRSEKLWEMINTEVFSTTSLITASEAEHKETSWPEITESNTELSGSKYPNSPKLYLKEKDFWGYQVNSTAKRKNFISLGLSVPNDWQHTPEIPLQTFCSSCMFSDNDNEMDVKSDKLDLPELPELYVDQVEQSNGKKIEAKDVLSGKLSVGEIWTQNDKTEPDAPPSNIKNYENRYCNLKFVELLSSKSKMSDSEDTISCLVKTQKSAVVEKSMKFPGRLYSSVINISN